MSNNILAEISSSDLEAELKRREEARRRPTSPIGRWRVTTEGGEDGRATIQLGIHNGHLGEIALMLVPQMQGGYGLMFERLEDEIHSAGGLPFAVSVYADVAIKVASNIVSPREAQEFARWLGDGWSVTPGNYYHAVTIRRNG